MLLKKVSLTLLLVLLGSSDLQAEPLRDPTRPSGGVSQASHTATSSALVLNSVVNSGARSYAVINNKILSVGDRVQGVQIVAIGQNSVSLADGRTLRMFTAVTE